MTKMFSMMTVYGFLAMSGAYAQSSQPIQARIPFAFMAQNTTLKSGAYRLTFHPDAHTLLIRGLEQNSQAAFATVVPIGGSTFNELGKLVFQCFDKTCYLAEVWQGSIGAGRGLEVRQSERPRKLGFITREVTISIPAK
jgi:hypothetical protein